MVTLNIIMEGQTQIPGMSAEVAGNAAALRQALNQFFSRLLNRSDIQITIFMGNGYRNAARRYSIGEGLQYLVVDSDLPYDSRMEWFDKLLNQENPGKSIIIPQDKRDGVIFMVQEMEAWFLKQPECIEAWRRKKNYNRKYPDDDIASHSLIRNKDIEEIKKPSEKLNILIKKYIFNGSKAVKYGKLSVAPGLLNELSAERLCDSDRELSRFKASVSVL